MIGNGTKKVYNLTGYEQANLNSELYHSNKQRRLRCCACGCLFSKEIEFEERAIYAMASVVIWLAVQRIVGKNFSQTIKATGGDPFFRSSSVEKEELKSRYFYKRRLSKYFYVKKH